MIVAPTMDVVRRGTLIGFVAKLGNGSSGVLAGRKLNGNLALPIVIIRVVGTFQMVFTNLIMTTHVNRTTDRPLTNSMFVGRYKSVDAMNLRGGYQEPFVLTTPILDHRDGRYVRANMVALKYPDF